MLLKNKIHVRTHEGVRTQFGLMFVKTGIINKEFGKLFGKLFDFRQKGDYGDLFNFDEKTVSPLFKQVRKLLEEIKKHL